MRRRTPCGFAALQPWLRRWVRFQYPSADADDVVQDTYVRLYCLKTEARVYSHKAYLSRIARTVIIDRARRARVRSICVPDEDALNAHVCEAPLPNAVLDHKQRLARVLESLACLPDVDRKVFLLKRVEGMPTRDVARMLGLSISSVEKAFARSTKSLDQLRAF